MKTVELNVPDMSCGHCVATVKSALAVVRGVDEVDVSLERKRATVRAEDTVADGVLVEAVRKASYSAAVR